MSDTNKQPEIDRSEKIDLRFKIEDKAMRKEVLDKSKREAEYSFKDVSKGLYGTASASASKAVVSEVLINKPLKEMEAKWRNETERLAAMGATKGELIDLRDKIALKMGEYPAIVKGYIDQIVAEGGNPAEIVSKMAQSEARVSKLSEIFVKNQQYPELFEAVKFAFELPSEPKHIAKPKAFAEFADHIRTNSEVKDVAWMALRFLEPQEKLEFGEFYIQGLDAEEIKQFAEEGNKMGIFDPKQIETLLNTTLSDSQKKQYGLMWQAQHDFTKQAKRIMKENYGSRNAAADMLTFGNVGKFILKFAAVGTIFTNIAANIFVAGRTGSAAQILQAVNTYSLGAAAVLAGSSMVKKGEPLSEAFKDKATRENERKNDAREGIQNTVRGNPEWKNFIEEQNFLGGQALWEYRIFLRQIVQNNAKPLPQVKLKVAEFIKWLEIKINAEKKPYQPLLDQMKNLASEKSAKRDLEFENVMIGFDIFNMGETNLISAYKNEVLTSKVK